MINNINTFSRLFLSLILIISGVSKAFNIEAFSTEIALLIDTYFFSALISIRFIIAIFFCAIECFIGLLLLKTSNVFINLSTLLLFIFFLIITGINYLFPSDSGAIESCGCFGELIHFSAEMSFYKNILFTILAITLVTTNNANMCDEIKSLTKLMNNKITYMLFSLSFILPIYSYFFINSLSSNVYTLLYWTLLISLIILSYKLFIHKNSPIKPYKN